MRLAVLYLVLINFLDYITTTILIQKCGFWIEANPLLQAAMVQANSVYPILLVKITPLFIFGLMMWIMHTYHPNRYKLPIWIWIVMIINAFLTGVVIRTIYTINYV